MIAVSMCDDRSIDRLPRVDIEVALFATKTFICDFNYCHFLALTAAYIGILIGIINGAKAQCYNLFTNPSLKAGVK